MSVQLNVRAANAWGSGLRLVAPISKGSSAEAPMPTVGALAHRAAGYNEKTLADFHPALQSADSEILPEREPITARARDIVRNNGYAAGWLQTTTDGVIGPRGLRLAAKPDWRTLGKTEEWADEYARRCEVGFRSWAESKADCDIAGLSDFADHTTIAFKGCGVNGDSFALPLWKSDSRTQWKLRIQGIESDRVVNPNHRPDGAEWRGGIKIGKYGEHLAYGIAKVHPGDDFAYNGYQKSEVIEVPAFTSWGRRRVIQMIRRSRYGQARGVSLLTTIIPQLKQAETYLDYAMKSHMLNTLVAMIIKTPHEDIMHALGGGEKAFDILNKRKLPVLKGGGQVLRLNVGEEISPFSPRQVESNIDQFLTPFYKEWQACTGLSHELFTKDFSKSSYVGIRAGLMEAHRHFTSDRYWVATDWCQLWYELWHEEAVDIGYLDAPDFYAQKQAYCKAEWIGAAQGYTDRVKEVTASALALENNLTTHEIELGIQGLDYREVFEQKAREEKLMLKLKLTMPAKTATAAAASAPQKNDDEDSKKSPSDPATDKESTEEK
ncbi:MAG: phage portal protein [Casimicrobium sp.]